MDSSCPGRLQHHCFVPPLSVRCLLCPAEESEAAVCGLFIPRILSTASSVPVTACTKARPGILLVLRAMLCRTEHCRLATVIPLSEDEHVSWGSKQSSQRKSDVLQLAFVAVSLQHSSMVNQSVTQNVQHLRNAILLQRTTGHASALVVLLLPYAADGQTIAVRLRQCCRASHTSSCGWVLQPAQSTLVS